MIVNIDVIGTVGEGKTSICFMLKEFFEDLTENFEIEIKDEDYDKVIEFDWEQWEKYRERFKLAFKDKELKVNIVTHQVKKENLS